jgi:hypothetical protein
MAERGVFYLLELSSLQSHGSEEHMTSTFSA